MRVCCCQVEESPSHKEEEEKEEEKTSPTVKRSAPKKRKTQTALSNDHSSAVPVRMASNAERISAQIEANPDLMDKMKALEDNKEVKGLFEKIQKEVEEKKKEGMNEMYAGVLVAGKYKAEIAKHREALAPLMQLMMK